MKRPFSKSQHPLYFKCLSYSRWYVRAALLYSMVLLGMAWKLRDSSKGEREALLSLVTAGVIITMSGVMVSRCCVLQEGDDHTGHRVEGGDGSTGGGADSTGSRTGGSGAGKGSIQQTSRARKRGAVGGGAPPTPTPQPTEKEEGGGGRGTAIVSIDWHDLFKKTHLGRLICASLSVLFCYRALESYKSYRSLRRQAGGGDTDLDDSSDSSSSGSEAEWAFTFLMVASFGGIITTGLLHHLHFCMRKQYMALGKLTREANPRGRTFF